MDWTMDWTLGHGGGGGGETQVQEPIPCYIHQLHQFSRVKGQPRFFFSWAFSALVFGTGVSEFELALHW